MSKNLMRTLCMSLVAACLSCSGGFYKIADSPDAQAISDAAVDGLAYITTTVYLQNTNLLTAPAYRAEKDSSLSHLYIYAAFTHPTLGETQIPLYLVDFQTNSLNTTRGAELISKLPLSPDTRGARFLKIETRALQTNEFDLVMDIWRNSQSVIAMAAGAASGGQQMLNALNSAAGLLSRFESHEFKFAAQLAVPRAFEGARLTQIYFIVPTDDAASTLPFVDAEVRRARTAATIQATASDVRLREGSGDYAKLPYLVLDTRLTAFVDDPQVIPKRISASCAELTDATLTAARGRVATPGVFSAAQLEEERNQIDRAASIRLLSDAVNKKAYAEAVDHFAQYSALPESDSALYRSYFKPATDAMTRCATAKLESVPGNDQVRNIAKLVSEQVNLDADSRQALEELLSRLKTFLGASDHPDLKFLANTGLFARAAVRREGIEKVLYGRFFGGPIEQLKSSRRRSSAADAWMKTLQTQLDTGCSSCRLEASRVIAEYQARTLTAQAAALERSRIETLSEATEVRSNLRSYLAALTAVRPADSNIPAASAALQEIETLQSRVAHAAPGDGAVNELQGKMERASEIISRSDLVN
ncbi:hypothetical protein WME97_07915 [Sorangium sp. So ce367]|uniref:hypothetical protein n=1 Tax=Sorangium sp. So ce367 TaxID=3133305 RepID=UPI003F6490A0